MSINRSQQTKQGIALARERDHQIAKVNVILKMFGIRAAAFRTRPAIGIEVGFWCFYTRTEIKTNPFILAIDRVGRNRPHIEQYPDIDHLRRRINDLCTGDTKIAFVD